MTKRICLIAILVVSIIAFSSCTSQEPTITGEWYSEKDGVKLILSENGTFSMSDESLQDHELLAGTYRIEGNKFLYTPTDEAELSNTFSLEGDTLTLTYEQYSSTFKRVKK